VPNRYFYTDALISIADSDYDPLQRLIRTLQDVNGIAADTKFAYDALDRLTQVTDPKGLATDYGYNGFGDLTRLTSPDTGITGYTYDSAGNRKTQTDARNKTATYAYDALNRLTSIAYPTPSLDTSYGYDADASGACSGAGEDFTVGRLVRIQDGSGSTLYCYNRFGDITRKIQTLNGQVFTLRYMYAANGRLQTVVYPDLSEARYVYDSQGRIQDIDVKTASGALVQLLRSALYAPFGPVEQWTYGNGRVMTRTLNQNYQPGIVQVTGSGGLSLGYEFDAVGNLKKLRNGNQSDPPLRIYDYDTLNRLTENRNGGTNALLEGYGYDKTGNRTSATVGTTTTAYAYPTTNHRLTQVGSNARTYDANGNTTQIAGSPVKNYVYGDHNRMTQTKDGSTVKMNYVYNGKGEQVRKYLGATNTYTMYDEAGRWLGDYGNAGATAPTQQVIWFDDLPVGLLVGAGATQKLHYIEPDALGTPRVVVDPTRGTDGTAIWRWELTGEAFGNTAPNQNPDGDANSFVFNMRFPGQRYDAATGLHYNMHRDYSTRDGRYVQSDPIGLDGGINTYLYAWSSPLIRVDSSGLISFGSTCTNEQRIFISEEISRLANEMKEKAQNYCKNDNCKMSIVGDVMRFLSQANFSYNLGWPCAVTTTPNFIYIYPSFIGIKDPENLSNPNSGCGCFRSVLFHEAAHHAMGLGAAENDVRKETRNCVSCAGNKTEGGNPL
jgi:RHS repeat-associated protein